MAVELLTTQSPIRSVQFWCQWWHIHHQHQHSCTEISLPYANDLPSSSNKKFLFQWLVNHQSLWLHFSLLDCIESFLFIMFLFVCFTLFRFQGPSDNLSIRNHSNFHASVDDQICHVIVKYFPLFIMKWSINILHH